MCSWTSTVPGAISLNRWVWTQRRIGPEVWVSVKPFSDTSEWVASQRIGRGPNQTVNRDTDPSPRGSAS